MDIKLFAAFTSLFFLVACGQPAPRFERIKQPYQRFIPVPRQPNDVTGLPWSGAFALDTKTGQLCWTYDIVNNTKNDMWPNIPKCADLLQQHPN